MVKAQDIVTYYKKKLTDDESIRYLAIHAKRYACLLNRLLKIRKAISEDPIALMDIGPSYLTEYLEKIFPGDTVYSLGYSHPESRGGQLPEGVSINFENFIRFDLNDSQDRDKWITVPSCKLVVCAEVIEHLYTSPKLVLDFIRSFLDDAGVLVIQTPNAVTLYNRLTVLRGRNFIETIRENNQNPGHFREYTRDELFDLAKRCGFTVADFFYSNYFSDLESPLKIKLYRMIQSILGDSFKDGMTAILNKQNRTYHD